jgi:hypothetical protein
VRRAVRAGGLSISLQDSRREFYIPCMMTSNNAEWDGGGSTSATTAPESPYTGNVLMEKVDSWHHDVSPPRTRRDWIRS